MRTLEQRFNADMKKQERRCGRRVERHRTTFVCSNLLYYGHCNLKTANFINRLYLVK